MPLGPFQPIPATERKVKRSHINDLREALTGLADAYDVAVAEGFVGSRADWLGSLVGPQGPPGEDGTAGGTQEGETTGQAVAGIALDDGAGGAVETWLGTTADGGPTTYAITKLEDAGIGGGAVDSVNGQTGTVVLDAADVGAVAVGDIPNPPPIALNSAWGSDRGYPRLTKPLASPVLTFADQSAASLYWPCLVDLTASGGSGVALVYSTDHDAGAGGIYRANAASPLGTYTDAGLIYQDTAGGDQTETPSVVWNEATSLYHVYYQQEGAVPGKVGSQVSLLATTPTLTSGSFTRVGIVADMVSTVEPGDGHTGYFKPFRYGASWYAWSLYGGTTHARVGMWQSRDGIAWQQHGVRVGWQGPLIDTVTGYDTYWRSSLFGGVVILWHGQPWWIGRASDAAAGGAINPAGVYTAPLRPDLRGFAARPIEVTPAAQAWEGVGITYLGNALMWDGRVFLPYRAGDDNTTNAAFGVMEVV
jgi:hypothetical protein